MTTYYPIYTLQSQNEIPLNLYDDLSEFSDSYTPNYDEINIYPESEMIGYNFTEDSLNGESYYPRSFIQNFPIGINWYMESNFLKFDFLNCEYEKGFMLFTLKHVIENFMLPNAIDIQGDIILLEDTEIDNDWYDAKCFVYTVKDYSLTYHFNKTLDFTKHWINCRKYCELGVDSVTDKYPFRASFERTYTNSFRNFMFNIIGGHENIDPLEIFELSYHAI
jgi:hypothetical protein